MAGNWKNSTNPFSDSQPAYKDDPVCPPPAYDESCEENHPILEGPGVTVISRRKRSTAGTIGSLACICFYVPLIVAPLFVIGFFATIQNKVLQNKLYYPSGCILYASTDQTVFKLSQGGTCSLVIIGEAAISVLTIGLVIAALIKAAMGKWFSPLLICDLVLLVLIFITSLVVSIVLSIGFAVTCEAMTGYWNNAYQQCNLTPFPYVPTLYVEPSLRYAMVSAWIVSCIAFVFLVIQSLVTCLGCLMRARKTTVSVSTHDDFDDSRSSRY